MKIRILTENGLRYIELTEDEIQEAADHYAYTLIADRHEYIEAFSIKRDGKLYHLTRDQLRRCVKYCRGEI